MNGKAGEGSGVSSTQTQHRDLSFSSRAVHADDGISSHRAVAPAMHVATTFRYSDDPEQLLAGDNVDPTAPLDSHVYSRISNPNSARLEAVLSSLIGGPSIVYTSGLAAFHAMLVCLNPKRIAIGDGYHGCHGVIDMVSRLSGLKSLPLDCDPSELQEGDVIHVETPLNPTGEARDLELYAAKAKKVGAWLTVDATFAPPPLMDPLAFGADVIMHSGTKYFGGHSDMLCGVLSVREEHRQRLLGQLLSDRVFLGSVMGSLEGWLGMRSLRTLELRVCRQSASATSVVAWLNDQVQSASGGIIAKTVERVHHSSLQREASEEGSWLQRQMKGGHGPVFALVMKEVEMAKRLPSKLLLFHHATSLGGVESLIEWRAMSDKDIDPRLLRVSIGVEAVEDIKEDFRQAFEALQQEKPRGDMTS